MWECVHKHTTHGIMGSSIRLHTTMLDINVLVKHAWDGLELVHFMVFSWQGPVCTNGVDIRVDGFLLGYLLVEGGVESRRRRGCWWERYSNHWIIVLVSSEWSMCWSRISRWSRWFRPSGFGLCNGCKEGVGW